MRTIIIQDKTMTIQDEDRLGDMDKLRSGSHTSRLYNSRKTSQVSHTGSREH